MVTPSMVTEVMVPSPRPLIIILSPALAVAAETPVMSGPEYGGGAGAGAGEIVTYDEAAVVDNPATFIAETRKV